MKKRRKDEQMRRERKKINKLIKGEHAKQKFSKENNAKKRLIRHPK
jgi:hypothetical protein